MRQLCLRFSPAGHPGHPGGKETNVRGKGGKRDKEILFFSHKHPHLAARGTSTPNASTDLEGCGPCLIGAQGLQLGPTVYNGMSRKRGDSKS